MSQSLPHVEVSINPDGSVLVRTNAKVIIESAVSQAAPSAGALRTAAISRRLERLQKYDPATLAAATYDAMLNMGYQAAPMKETSNAAYIRMVYAAGGRSTTLYMDSKGLYSANAEQADFARTLEGAQPGSRHMVRFPFTLGQQAIDRIAQAFKDHLDHPA